MKPLSYSYKDVYSNMPSALKKDTYIYDSNGVGVLVLCTKKSDNNDYRTTVKHSGDTLYYCIDYSSHFTDDTTFESNTTIFSDELRARIALAIQLGASTWKNKASDAYTTGNFVEDYYMTQIVIHSLIYKYGDKLKDHGVKYSDFVFKSGTGNLESKTKALYDDCCKAIYSDKTGSFQSASFQFDKNADNRMLISADGNSVSSDLVNCLVDVNNASVAEFKRESILLDPAGVGVMVDINSQDSNDYNSSFVFSVPISVLDTFNPGIYTAKIDQDTAFKRVIAKEWFCSQNGFENNQAVAGYSTTNTSASDSFSMNLLIGSVELIKKDRITGALIEDAQFQLLQYNNATGEYTFYKNLTYNPGDKKYYSGNIYAASFNPDGKFKVIESDPGKRHINDWPGQEFILSPDNLLIKIEASDTPKLGKLIIHKTGDAVSFDKEKGVFNKTDNKINIPGVKFEIYAKEDIILDDVTLYNKDQKIYDVVTDTEGRALVNDVFPGKYYIKETDTNPQYLLDPDIKDFEVKDEDGEYKDITYSMNNELKKCSVSLFKYTNTLIGNNENKDKNKLPLANCKFGLFAKDNITDPLGNIIVAKDTKIKEGITDSNGQAVFDDLIFAEYYLKELEVPKGVLISDEIIDVTKDKFEITANTDKEYSVHFEVFNKKQEYKINLNKLGEQFISATQKDSDNGAYYEYNLDYAPLKNATYSIYNASNEKIYTSTSDDNGLIEFGPLEYGDYYCIEESAPDNYYIDSSPIKISCTELNEELNTNSDGAAKDDDNKALDVKETDNTSKKNQIIKIEETAKDNMCSFNLEILKLGEKNYVKNKALKSKFEPLEGVIFGIYQDFEYSFPSGEKLAANTCLGYIVTDSTGRGKYNGKLPIGLYHLQELKTMNGYDIDNSIHGFEIKANSNNDIIIDLSNAPYKNYLSKSGVKIVKTDSNSGKRLKGVEFTLYDANKNQIGLYKTDSKGEITVENLPYGSYYFIETKARKGYYSSNNRYNFKLDSAEYRRLEITNSPILKLGFNEHYIIYFAFISLIILSGVVYIIIHGSVKK